MLIIKQNFWGASGFVASCGYKKGEKKESVGRAVGIALALSSGKPEGHLGGLQTRELLCPYSRSGAGEGWSRTAEVMEDKALSQPPSAAGGSSCASFLVCEGKGTARLKRGILDTKYERCKIPWWMSENQSRLQWVILSPGITFVRAGVDFEL